MADLGIMFTPDGKPSPLLIARWRSKGGQQAIQPRAVLVGGGYATPAFRGIWRAAFPLRTGLPSDPVATTDGRFTQAMLDVWA